MNWELGIPLAQVATHFTTFMHPVPHLVADLEETISYFAKYLDSDHTRVQVAQFMERLRALGWSSADSDDV